MPYPKIIDNDRGEITATLAGEEIRGWSYTDDAERCVKMRAAREFAEGWFQAMQRHRQPAPMTAAEIAALEALQEFAHLHELCRNGMPITQAMHHEAEDRLYAAWAEVEAEHDGRWTAPD